MAEEIAEQKTNEELDVMSLLVNEDENAHDDVDGVEEEEVLGSDPDYKALYEAERAKVLKRNKSLKISKGSQHRTEDEYNALLKRMDLLEDTKATDQSDKAAELLDLEDQEWQEKVEDDISQLPKYMAWREGKQESRIAEFLSQKFAQLQSATVDPEMQKYSKQIDTLAKRLPGVSRESLLPLAKELSGTKVPRGSAGGSKGNPAPRGSDENYLDGLSKDENLKKMGFRGED